MLRIAVIGCGTMAESHFIQIEKIPFAKLVGVCDAEILMAKQVTLRYDVSEFFDNVDELIDKTKPDIIHITTPPDSHYSLAKKCLKNGIHIYVEKPFTLYYNEALDLINIAEEKKLKLTVGHNAQFSPAAIKLRNLVKSGYLGGSPVHMDSIYCYNWGNESYAKSIIGNANHWVNQLPGKLLQNIISHGISKIAEFLDTDNPKVIVDTYKSDFIEKLGSSEIVDELRVIIRDQQRSSYFTFSSTIKPQVHSFKIYGPKRTLELNHNTQTLIKYEDFGYRSYLRYVLEPRKIAKQYRLNSRLNLKGLYKKEIRGDFGIEYLTQAFYNSVLDKCDLPISYQEILLTSKIMENIFSQIYSDPKFIQD